MKYVFMEGKKKKREREKLASSLLIDCIALKGIFITSSTAYFSL